MKICFNVFHTGVSLSKTVPAINVLHETAVAVDRRVDGVSLALQYPEFEIQQLGGNVQDGGGMEEGHITIEKVEHFIIAHEEFQKYQVLMIFRNVRVIGSELYSSGSVPCR